MKTTANRIARLITAYWLISLVTANTAVATEPGVCEIDQENSVVVIRVYKEGKLSAFGDNHLISTSHLEGQLTYDAGNPDQSGFLLSVPTQSLIVNDPELRAKAEAAFNSKVSALNRRITRKSMLGKKVLYAQKYPHIHIKSLQLPAQLSGTAIMAVTLRETTRSEDVSIRSTLRNEKLHITGQFQLKQSDYGIAPFSIMFGGIRVQDALRLDFDLRSHCPTS